MKTRNLALCALCSIVVSGALSCKKTTNNNPFGTARISTIELSHHGAIQNYRFFYDSYNNIDSIDIIGAGTSSAYTDYRKFSYFGSSYSITDKSRTTFTILANTSGQILKLMIKDTTSMIYNGTELGEIDVKTETPTYPYYLVTATNYWWKDGNVTTVSSGGVTKTYSYDNTKNGQPGDPFRIDAFISYGRSLIKTTHLPKELSTGGNWVEKYFYEFTNKGLISQLLKVKNNNGIGLDDSTVYKYGYY